MRKTMLPLPGYGRCPARIQFDSRTPTYATRVPPENVSLFRYLVCAAVKNSSLNNDNHGRYVR